MIAAGMRRFLVFVGVICLVAVPYASWALFEDFDDPLEPGSWLFSGDGSASHDETNGWLVLTPAVADAEGSAFLTETIDSTKFRVSFKLYIGDGSGADGMVFAWVSGAPWIGGGGGSMGFFGGGLTGYGVKFDTYTGGDPEPENYIAVVDGAEASNTNGFFSNDTIPELEDAGWFYVQIEVDNGHLQMWMSNESQGYPLTQVLDDTIPGYTGFNAYFGFTAATGGATNNHWVDDLAINVGAIAGDDQVVESGDVVTLDGSESYAATSYHWEQIIVGTEPSVTIDDPDPADGITTFTAPTVTEGVVLTFRLTIQTADEPSSDDVQVTVRAKNAPTLVPQNLRTYARHLGYRLEWDAMIDADEFGVGFKMGEESYFWFWTTNAYYDLTNLTEGDATTIAVMARNSYGDGPRSEDITLVPMRNYALPAGTTPPSGYVSVGGTDVLGMNDGVRDVSSDSSGTAAETEDFWGYLWAGDIYIDHVTYFTGAIAANGGWFTDLRVQVTQDGTAWINVPTVIVPDYDFTDQQSGKQPFTRYDMYIPTLYGVGVRVAGTPGGTATFTSIAELEVYADMKTSRPLVVQGIDGEVAERATGTIDASFSFSTQGDITSMIYEQISGPTVTITVTGDPLIATFEAPGVDADTGLVFQITGSDGTDTLSDELTITVKNLVTTAVAGPDQIFPEATTATLDGSGSLTTTGTLTYQWTQTSGDPVTLNNANAAIADFEAPILWAYREGLTFQLEVNDGAGGVSTDEVAVKVRNFLTPADFEAEPIDPANWQFFGNASFDDTAGILELTAAVNDQVGAAWMNDPIDCSEFLAKFKVYIGDGDGADGMVFGWVTSPGIGAGGGGMGWYSGGLNGFAIVFDTYPNPAMNRVSFEELRVHPGGDTGGYAYYDPPIDLENSGWFDVEIDMDNGHIQVWMSNETAGLPRTLAIDHTLADYTGFDAYFGFGGATGGLNNNHWADEHIGVFLPTDLPNAYAVRELPASYEAGGNVDVSLSMRVNPDGTPSDVTVSEPIPAGLTVVDDGGGTVVGQSINWTFGSGTATTQVINYTLGAPAGMSGALNFTGTITFPGTTENIMGDNIIYETPSAPQNLSVETLIMAHLYWTPSPEEGVTSYRVYRSANGGAWELYATVSGNSYDDKWIEEGNTYNYQVSAVNSMGVEGALSDATGQQIITIMIREAEDFNYGGGQWPGTQDCPAAIEATAVDDLTGTDFWHPNTGGPNEYRPANVTPDGIGIETIAEADNPSEFHTNIGWIDAGSWYRYTFDIPAPGPSDPEGGWVRFSFRVACPNGGTLAAYWDEVLVGTVSYVTGNYHIFTEVVMEAQVQTTPGVHTLRVESTAGELNLDKIGVEPNAPEPTWETFFEDDFEDYTTLYSFDDFVAAGYTVNNGSGVADGAWRLWNTGGNNLGNESPALDAMTNNYANADSDLAGAVDADEELITPSIDCTGHKRVRLDFNMNYKVYVDDVDHLQTAEVDIRTSEDGVTWGNWVNLLSWDRTTVADAASGSEQVDISAHADGKFIQVRWRYYNGNYDYWFAVDDIRIAGDKMPPPIGEILSVGYTEGVADLTWEVFGDGNYTVEYTTDLTSGSWDPIPDESWPITDTNWSGDITGIFGQGVYLRVRSE